MATTTFSGPIKSGPIVATIGTDVSKGEVKNTGNVQLCQTSNLVSHDDNASGPTGIVIPANSQIVSIEFYV